LDHGVQAWALDHPLSLGILLPLGMGIFPIYDPIIRGDDGDHVSTIHDDGGGDRDVSNRDVSLHHSLHPSLRPSLRPSLHSSLRPLSELFHLFWP